MDPNLTHPIILNATLNATLVQPPQSIWKDWLPAIVSVLVVILGGFITYYVTITIERNKRQFELRKQVYFDAIEIFANIFRSKDSSFYNQRFQRKKEQLQKEKKMLLSANLEEIEAYEDGKKECGKD